MKDPSNLLLGTADGTFTERAKQAGILSYKLGRGAALVDLNLDGLLDLVQVPRGTPVLGWRNVGSGSAKRRQGDGPLGIPRPRSARRRTEDAIGAWIEVRTGDQVQRRELTVGGGHAGGQLGPIHFGLGDATDAAGARAVARRRMGRVAATGHRPVPDHRPGRHRVGAHDAAAIAQGDPMSRARIGRIDLPDLSMPTRMPTLAPDVHRARLDRLCAMAAERGYDRLVVYADREHSANISYLTGFDPRFEEAVLVVGDRRRPGDPRGQRMLGHGRGGAGADAPAPVPGHEPAQPATRPVTHPGGDPG